MKTLKKVLYWIAFLLGAKGEVSDEAVREGLIDHSGQGRDEFGR